MDEPVSTPEPASVPQAPTTQESSSSTSGRSLLDQLAFRPNRPHLFIGLLFLILGLLVSVALIRPGTEESWRNARTEDLVQILDDAESARLTELQRNLESGSTVEALAESKRQLAALQVLTGTTPVTGPGVSIVISDPEGVIDAAVVLDAVQELRDAGAEAIQVGDSRVVVETWFADRAGGVVVSGAQIDSPIRILAIGEPDTMAAALSIPGGIADSVRTRGADFEASTAPSMSISVTVPETTN
jgi:uncharacterized protein YlxW (UPF0749 family)